MKTEDVSAVLRRAIRRGVLKPGELLVQEEIAGRLGVSRVPLREALRGLAAVGLVQRNPGQGFRVTELNVEEVEELYNLRLRIEPFMAEAIVKHASAPWIEALADLERSMIETDDPEVWANLDYDFHLLMYAGPAGNHSQRIVRQLLDLVEPYSRLYVHKRKSPDRVQGEHEVMLDSIRKGDVDKLSSTIRLHLEGVRDGLIELMGADGKTDDPLSRLMGLSGST